MNSGQLFVFKNKNYLLLYCISTCLETRASGGLFIQEIAKPPLTAGVLHS